MVADFTSLDGFTPGTLAETKDYNPYLSSSAPWSSILMYNSYGINPASVDPNNTEYVGLFKYNDMPGGNNGSSGNAIYDIEEKGHIDEYSINFGGNVMNVLYWGVGFGITDLDFKQYAYYSENLSNANVPDANAAHIHHRQCLSFHSEQLQTHLGQRLQLQGRRHRQAYQ